MVEAVVTRVCVCATEEAEEEVTNEEEETATPRASGAQEEAPSQADIAVRNAAFWETLLLPLWGHMKAEEEANGSPASAAAAAAVEAAMAMEDVRGDIAEASGLDGALDDGGAWCGLAFNSVAVHFA